MNSSATLFIDESGNPNLVHETTKQFLVTGVLVAQSTISDIDDFFVHIKQQYGIPTTTAFHSFDIYEHPKSRLPNDTLVALSADLATYIQQLDANVYIASIDKGRFKDALGVQSVEDFKGHDKKREVKEYPYRVLVAYLFAKFGNYLASNNIRGTVLAESRGAADKELVTTLAQCKQQTIPLQEKYAEAIRSNIIALSFAEKNYLAGGLELADLISYTSFAHIHNKLKEKKERGLPLVWKAIHERFSHQFHLINEDGIRTFFKLQKGEMHKNLRP